MGKNRNSCGSGTKASLFALVSGIFVLFCSPLSFASESEKTIKYSISNYNELTVLNHKNDTIKKDLPVSPNTKETISNDDERESIFGVNRPLDNSHFTWGADFGASVDLTAHDMSTFDLDIFLGYKNSFFKTIGVGGGVHRTVQGGDNFLPVYFLLRTSFTSKPSLFFLNVRIGYSFNAVENSPRFGDYNSSFGLGINLSQSRKAKTYVIIGGSYRYFNKKHREYISRIDTPYIWMAQLQFGVNF